MHAHKDQRLMGLPLSSCALPLEVNKLVQIKVYLDV
jgi:hypothetical protein